MYCFCRRAGVRAFTLIELLVTIAIIVLLIAILIPPLHRARENAKTTVCLAHMRGIATAFHLYAEDKNGYLPGSSGDPQKLVINRAQSIIIATEWYGGVNSTTPPYFFPTYGALSDYWGKPDIMRCPSMVDSFFINLNEGNTLVNGPIDYAYNTIDGGSYPYGPAIKISDVKNPSEHALVWDSLSVSVQGYNTPNPTFGSKRTPDGFPPWTGVRSVDAYVDPNFHGCHLGKGNVSWLDGHAESVKPYLADDLGVLGNTTWFGVSPTRMSVEDKKQNIGFIYDGPNPPGLAFPPPPRVNRFYDPAFP